MTTGRINQVAPFQGGPTRLNHPVPSNGLSSRLPSRDGAFHLQKASISELRRSASHIREPAFLPLSSPRPRRGSSRNNPSDPEHTTELPFDINPSRSQPQSSSPEAFPHGVPLCGPPFASPRIRKPQMFAHVVPAPAHNLRLRIAYPYKPSSHRPALELLPKLGLLLFSIMILTM